MRTILKGSVQLTRNGEVVEERKLHLELNYMVLPPGTHLRIMGRLILPERSYYDVDEGAMIHELKLTIPQREADRWPYLKRTEPCSLPF